MTMTDREKVLKGLECCCAMSGHECRQCPYSDECIGIDQPYGMAHLAADAFELLKAKEPRVLTLAEVESSDGSVWLERNMPEWETPIAVLVDKVGKYLDTFIAIGGLCFQGEKSQGQEYGDYGKTWRCWSAKPTEEQRKAVKWNE